MPLLTVTKRIDGPIDQVFEVFADIEKAPQRVDGIERIEMLTDGPPGVGTRWRETRIMFKKEATEEMGITEFDPGKSYKVESSSCGTQYATTFTFTADGSSTEVEMSMEATPVTFGAKFFSILLWPLMKWMTSLMRKCVESDMNDLKRFVESGELASEAAGN